MRFNRLGQLLAASSILSLVGAEGTSDVIDLTPNNFNAIVNPESLMLVEFFAPWCGHCKALAPHYEEAASALLEKNIKLAKVNCVDEAELCQANGIQGYPTLRVYRHGEHSDYTGPRKADGIISYMTKQSLPAVADVTAASFDEFTKADKLVVMAFVSSTQEAPAAEFSATANKYRDDYLFGLTTDAGAIAAAGVSPPALVLYRAFDEPVSAYPYPVASAKVKDIEEWIKDLAIPVIDEVTTENYQVYASSGKPLAYLFVDPTDPQLAAHVEALRPVAAKHKDRVNFVHIDAIKFGDHAKALNLNEVKWPSFVLQDLAKQLKYPLDQSREVTPEAVDEMVTQFLDGKLQPQLKSQAVPETQDGPVFNLVSKQFDQVVFDDEKDVFVEFYASWCGHCKRLAPIWDNLGERYADIKDRITIAKMEATENDLPPSVPFRISGFPTLKFKQAGAREFIDYEGDRSLESLIAFVEENAKNSLERSVPETQPEQVPMQAEHEHEHEHHDEL